MRLGALLLIAALPAAGQEPTRETARTLPWQRESAPPWQPLAGVPEPAPASGPAAQGRTRVRLEGDGTLQVWDPRGIRTLRMGLPGRPLRAWRDGGVPAPLGSPSQWAFPEATPLSQGLGHLAWGAPDFRPSLAGLLWVLEDGEGYLTVVNPATAAVIHLRLPLGSGFDLDFQPDRLLLRALEGPPGVSGPRAWSLPWLALLPQLVRLGPPAAPPKAGTALAPFPH
ncbi:MAG TPA: hypothetical protein VJ600_05160 [Holophagaceae bacterium]|nr:hypothetical protein [Holophagaceae bacterium]